MGPPICVGGREARGGVRPFLFSTENSQIVAYSLPFPCFIWSSIPNISLKSYMALSALLITACFRDTSVAATGQATVGANKPNIFQDTLH